MQIDNVRSCRSQIKTKKLLLIPLLVSAALLASCSKPSNLRTQAFAQLPDWHGIWVSEEGINTGISGFPEDLGKPGMPPRPILDPAAPWSDIGRADMATMFTNSAKRKADGWGYPMMMFGPAPLELVITPEETLIINIYHEVRHIYTDGRGHPAEEDRWATTWGDSVGHWEGDTLVVDTVSVRNPPRYFQMSPPFSEQAHYVERMHLSAQGSIELEMTITDPIALTAPLTVKTSYVRTPNLDRLIHDAFENDRSELEGDVFTITPPKNE